MLRIKEGNMELEAATVFDGECECCGLKFSEGEFCGIKRDGIAYCETCDEERLESWEAQDEHASYYGYGYHQ